MEDVIQMGWVHLNELLQLVQSHREPLFPPLCTLPCGSNLSEKLGRPMPAPGSPGRRPGRSRPWEAYESLGYLKLVKIIPGICRSTTLKDFQGSLGLGLMILGQSYCL